jgi:hypothetical protein
MSAATASSESSSPLQQLQTTMSSLQQQQQQQRFELYRILSVFLCFVLQFVFVSIFSIVILFWILDRLPPPYGY